MNLLKTTGTANDDSQEPPPNHNDAPESQTQSQSKVEECQSHVKAPTQRPTVEVPAKSPRIVSKMQQISSRLTDSSYVHLRPARKHGPGYSGFKPRSSGGIQGYTQPNPPVGAWVVRIWLVFYDSAPRQSSPHQLWVSAPTYGRCGARVHRSRVLKAAARTAR